MLPAPSKDIKNEVSYTAGLGKKIPRWLPNEASKIIMF